MDFARHLISMLGLTAFLVLAAGSFPLSPEPEVLSRDLSAAVFSNRQGEPDAGFKATYLIRNKGVAGTMRVRVSLFCSEGTFHRERTVRIGEGETQQLIFQFAEPSMFADNARIVEQIESFADETEKS